MINSRKPEDLHPDMQPLFRGFLAECEKQGYDVLVTCTYRDNESQNALYAQGRTRPGKIVTNARGGQSQHNFTIGGKPASRAFDIVPMRHGKPVWDLSGNGIDNDPSDDDKDDLELWLRIADIGESVGLEWAGRWTRFKEFPHFQLHAGE